MLNNIQIHLVCIVCCLYLWCINKNNKNKPLIFIIMITRENLSEVIKNIDVKDQSRLRNSNKEYCVIYLHCFNAGCYATITLTNNFSRYMNVSNNGNCIPETSEVLTILNS